MKFTVNAKRDRNNSIDIFRYICAIMVVCIHTSPFSEVNPKLEYIFTQIFPRIAVPFFFIVSGYFYIKNFQNDFKNTKEYIIKIFKVYAFWSIIYFFLQDAIFMINNFIGLKSIIEFVLKYIIDFLFFGSSYHFWFFPAIIISIILTYIFYKNLGLKWLIIISIFCYLIVCLGCSYYNIGLKIPILNMLIKSEYFTAIRRVFLMGFPFFASGSIVHYLYNKIYSKKKNEDMESLF